MKKVLFVLLSLSLACIQLGSAKTTVSTLYYLDGPTSLTLYGTSVGGSYNLYPVPSGGTYVWSLTGSGGYITSIGSTYCSLTFYQTGSFKLECDIYVGGVKSDTATSYITVN
ncbi:hypothetical protein AGMMS49574_11370 [Bacteroidia bacterium]|nr:hypothetical protein AGMMS49574_11370 [Bacteroidia bacterium]